MDIHEYQAKEILSSYGVQILDGELALNTCMSKIHSPILLIYFFELIALSVSTIFSAIFADAASINLPSNDAAP